MSEPGTNRWLDRLGYASGETGIRIGGTPLGLLFLFYLTNIVGMRADVAGLVLGLPKIWDALVDPMLGGWIDRQIARLHHRAPFMVLSGIGYLAALYFLFSLPHLGSALSLVALATVLSIALSTSQTVFGVCQLSMVTAMTKNTGELNTLLSLSNVAISVIGIAASVLVPLALVWSGGGWAGYSRMSAETAGVAALFIAAGIVLTWYAPIRPEPAGATAIPLFRSVLATRRNRSFYYLMAYLIVLTTGAAILGTFLPYANLYVLHDKQSGLAVLGGISTIAGIAGLPLAAPLSRWLGARRWLLVGNALMSLMYGSLYLASFGERWLTWVAIGLVSICSGALGIVMQTTLLGSMTPKANMGQFIPMGVYLGILVAGTKLGGSAASFIAGELLHAIGFVSGGAHQSVSTLEWLRAGYTLIPMVFFLGAGFFLHHVEVTDDLGGGTEN